VGVLVVVLIGVLFILRWLLMLFVLVMCSSLLRYVCICCLGSVFWNSGIGWFLMMVMIMGIDWVWKSWLRCGLVLMLILVSRNWLLYLVVRCLSIGFSCLYGLYYFV